MATQLVTYFVTSPKRLCEFTEFVVGCLGSLQIAESPQRTPEMWAGLRLRIPDDIASDSQTGSSTDGKGGTDE